MEPSSDLQFGLVVRAAEAWLPAQFSEVCITDVMGKNAAGGAALTWSMRQHCCRAKCTCQKHY